MIKIKRIIQLIILSSIANVQASEIINNKVIVLAYHGISDKINNMNTSLKQFQEQISYLKENHYNVITSDELYNSITKHTSIPNKAVLLTFDDGWKNQTLAMEELTKNKMPATFGLVTMFQKVNSTTGLQKIDFEKYKNSNFTYVNHSFTHNIKKFPINTEEDLIKSESVLKDIFNKIEPYYIYPYGKNNIKLINSLKAHGYKMVFGVDDKIVNTNTVDLYHIPRYLVNGKLKIEDFKKLINKVN